MTDDRHQVIAKAHISFGNFAKKNIKMWKPTCNV
jgi:hypothetical protein